MSHLKSNMPIDKLKKYIIYKTKPFLLTGKNIEESREIFEYSKRSLPDVLVVRKGFFEETIWKGLVR
ncbi:hypothetical protein J7J62_07860 [bacterium]|nr:hypothetical protein [bacterium]